MSDDECQRISFDVVNHKFLAILIYVLKPEFVAATFRLRFPVGIEYKNIAGWSLRLPKNYFTNVKIWRVFNCGLRNAEC